MGENYKMGLFFFSKKGDINSGRGLDSGKKFIKKPQQLESGGYGAKYDTNSSGLTNRSYKN